MNEVKHKQFIIIPRNPKMSAGKIASLVAHTTFMALENQKTFDEKGIKAPGNEEYLFSNGVVINEWKTSGQCVIVLECPSQLELHGMKAYCEQWNIPHHMYVDEGFTKIPAGTATAFATGVLTEEQFIYFSQFKLFKKRWWQL